MQLASGLALPCQTIIMKIAFVSPYPPSQVTLNEYGYHLIRSFAGKYGVSQIDVLTNHLENNDDYKRYAQEGINIIPCWKFNSVQACWQIVKTLRALKPDVVIMNLQFMTFGESKVAAALGLLTPWLCRLSGLTSMVILHNITETVKLDTIGMAGHPLVQKVLLKIGETLTRMILKADLVGLTIAQYVHLIQEKYKAQNVVLLPHGNFELPGRCYLQDDLKEVNLLAFGKFGTYKKVEVMLDALGLLAARHPQIKFRATIAGTDNPNVKGYLSSVQQQYKHLKNVVYTGYVAEEDVEQLFKQSSFVVFPYTTTTGSSGILHQAGSYARACILPMIDDLKRIVEEEGYGGAYFETDDAESLARAVTHLLNHPEERKLYEDMNYKAARGLPMNELAEWYLLHAQQLLSSKPQTIPQHAQPLHTAFA